MLSTSPLLSTEAPSGTQAGRPGLCRWHGKWLQSQKAKSPSGGGAFCRRAIVSLSCLYDCLVDSLSLVELDEDVAAVWQVIVNDKGRI